MALPSSDAACGGFRKVNFSANRRSPEHCEYHEDPIPLHDVQVTLTLPGGITNAYDVHTGVDVPIMSDAGSHTLTIPRVRFGAVIALDATHA